MINRWKMGITSSPYGLYKLGYTRVTIIFINRTDFVKRRKSLKKILVRIIL